LHYQSQKEPEPEHPINNYLQTPHFDRSELGPSQPNIGSDAARQSPRNVSCDYPDHIFSHYQFQKGPEPEHPVNDHKSESHVCKWRDGNVLCNRPVKASRGGIAEHMSEYHFTSSEPADSPFNCQWHGCHRLEPYRRDTIIRHFKEVHLKMPRPKSVPARGIGPIRNTKKSLTT